MMRQLIRQFLQRFGYDIVKTNQAYRFGVLTSADAVSEYAWLKKYAFSTILDIGANEGQFSEKMRLLFPDARIHAFEPLAAVHARLRQHFAADQRFTAHACAVGAEDGEATIYHNESSASSSLLPMTEQHTQNFTHAVATTPETIVVRSLASLAPGLNLQPPFLLKMDVQGFEAEVIRGGRSVVAQADVIITEVSFEKLYANQPLFDDLYTELKALGFRYAGSAEQLLSPHTQQVLQADAIFVKR